VPNTSGRTDRAALLAEKERRERRRRNLNIGGVAAIVVLVLVVALFLSTRGGDNSDEIAAAAPGPGSEHGLTIGDAGAPHSLVIYEDFLCPFCGELEASSHSELEQLADDGQVRVEYRPFAFLTRYGDYSGDATEAFGSVLTQQDQATALAMHDLLFADQPEEDGDHPSRADLAETMRQAGADDATVQHFEDGDGAAWADAATKAAQDVGVDHTPVVILDGEAFTEGETIEERAEKLLAALG
jgi:protein-disulfide isomerase